MSTYNPKEYVGFDSEGKFQCLAWLYEPRKGDYDAKESSRPRFSQDSLVLDLSDGQFITYYYSFIFLSLSHKKGISSKNVEKKKLINSFNKVLSFSTDNLSEREREAFEKYARALFEISGTCKSDDVQDLRTRMLNQGIVKPTPACEPQGQVHKDKDASRNSSIKKE